MKYSIIIPAAAIILFVSCKKDSGRPEENPDKLVRTVEKEGSDSVVTNYEYDNDGRLISIKTSGMLGFDRTGSFEITRGAGGEVTRTVEKTAQMQLAGCDSALNRFFYSPLTGKYTYLIITADYPGNFVYDSVVYSYDGQARIIREHHFQTQSGAPGMNQYWLDFGYSAAGNLDSVKYSETNPPPVNYNVAIILTYTYDQRTNPLIMGNEAVLFYQFPFFGAFNATGLENLVFNSPNPNYFITSLHTYNESGFPLTTITSKSTGSVSNTTWYYE